ncbi:hypothetical protein [Pontibacter liquoris]|uniref:hypothetical protein n=1 Tax=Pontibacter liquoris TaxID=2905677 RepID=UPI001FA6DA78|nr:hypothetical protein [Pontibacter liquoris]
MINRLRIPLAFAALLCLGSCNKNKPADTGDNYLQVIGEYEQQLPGAGYRLNLSYNGPVAMRHAFVAWADSLQNKVPDMVKSNESIYVNYMPGQTGMHIRKDMYQTNITYILTVADSSLYAHLTQDLLRRNFPFTINVVGAALDPAKKLAVQQHMLEQALVNARAKLGFLAGKEHLYKITSIEELDNTMPYGPEYYDFNRKMISRVKVRATLE